MKEVTQEVTIVEPVRLNNPTLAEYCAYVKQNKVIVITGASRNWNAFSAWTADYLEEKVGSVKVPVLATVKGKPVGRFFYEGTSEATQVELRECLGLLRGGRPVVYMAGVPIAEYFPSLLEDFQTPEVVKNAKYSKTQIWISGSNSIGPLHYDLENNVHAVIKGKKRFRLFDFQQTPRLYANSVLSFSPQYSQISPDKPDYERFPKFREATGYDVTLQPGEMIYMPTGLWHQVETLEPSIAINFWLGRNLLKVSTLRLLFPMTVAGIAELIASPAKLWRFLRHPQQEAKV
jgi:hypothetical protein